MDTHRPAEWWRSRRRRTSPLWIKASWPDLVRAYVAEQLAGRGWDVDFWGQGQLSRALQSARRQTDSSIRWFPDLIAAKAKDLVLIGCKGGMTSRRTGRHAVEWSAVMAHLQLVAWTQLPVYYVFDGLDARSPTAVLGDGALWLHQPTVGPLLRAPAAGVFVSSGSLWASTRCSPLCSACSSWTSALARHRGCSSP
ncbi:hypothetical protein [Streptomyces sp. NBC_01465]|uniref:hypothetical protein n=1 Tax=Streptomyces sp. NBC_01465 TaxID=2903878 RepID=UPI002E35ADB8|nr:hypothetical protein [Streptomyces sp. NBC_01465]